MSENRKQMSEAFCNSAFLALSGGFQQRLILELKDKLSLEEAFEQKLAHTAQSEEAHTTSGMQNEAVQALVALGYSSSEALKAVSAVELTEQMDTEALLKAALKKMAFL